MYVDIWRGGPYTDATTASAYSLPHSLFPLFFAAEGGEPNNVLYTFSSFPFSRIERGATDVDHNSKEETTKKIQIHTDETIWEVGNRVVPPPD